MWPMWSMRTPTPASWIECRLEPRTRALSGARAMRRPDDVGVDAGVARGSLQVEDAQPAGGVALAGQGRPIVRARPCERLLRFARWRVAAGPELRSQRRQRGRADLGVGLLPGLRQR